ncbi:hypothetical protein F5876DRAFT_22222, partial [Lentinula aff. lateritia]
SRNNRGLENDMTGGLLCPGEIDWNDNTMKSLIPMILTKAFFKVISCFKYVSVFLLLFLHLIPWMKTYRTIFTSPSSAKGQSEDVENLPPSKKKKTSNSHRAHVANIIHMTEVTPRSIAYAAVHLHIALTDTSHWTHSYDSYNYQDLWNFVVDFFKDPINEEAEKQGKELLKWW